MGRSVEVPSLGVSQRSDLDRDVGTVTAFGTSSAVADLADLTSLARRLFAEYGVAQRLEVAANEIHRHLGRPVAVAALSGRPLRRAEIVGAISEDDRDVVASAFEALVEQRRAGEAAVGSRSRRGRALAVHAGSAGIVVLDAPRGAGRFLDAVATVVAGAVEAEKQPVLDQTMTLAWMAHEIRSPLAGIGAALDQALVDADPARARSLIERGRRDLSRISTLADSLLRWGNPHRDELELRRVSLLDTVREAVNEADLEIATDRIAIEGSDDAELLADPVQLKVAVVNLLRNAVAYSSRGTVTVAVAVDRGRGTITVVDPGGTSGVLDDGVFDAFARGSDATTLERRGAGLGLFICRKIVEAHGGTVCVERRSSGTAFRIEMPAAARSRSRCAS